MIRATLDANALISAFPAESGTMAELIEQWRASAYQLVVSEHIVEEVRRNWTKPYWRNRFSQSQVDRALVLLRTDADMTPIAVEVIGVATHAEDDLVIATAVSGNADYIVTGDIPFRDVGSYLGISIISPREFLDLLNQE